MGRPPALVSGRGSYIDAGRELLGDDGDAYKDAITRRFPTYRGALLIDIANGYLFGHQD